MTFQLKEFDLNNLDKLSELSCENKKCDNKIFIKTKWIKNADKCDKKWVQPKTLGKLSI